MDKQKDLIHRVLVHLNNRIKLNKKSQEIFQEYLDFYKQEPEKKEPKNENDPEIMYDNYSSW